MEVNLIWRNAMHLLLLPTGEILPDSGFCPWWQLSCCNQSFYFWQMASMVVGMFIVVMVMLS